MIPPVRTQAASHLATVFSAPPAVKAEQRLPTPVLTGTARPPSRRAPTWARVAAAGLAIQTAAAQAGNLSLRVDIPMLLPSEPPLEKFEYAHMLLGLAQEMHVSPQRWPQAQFCHVTETPPAPLFGKYPLYKPDALPHPSDITRKQLENSWFLTPLGSLAQQCPDVLASNIRVSPDGSSLKVRLFDQTGATRWVEVTERDLEENLKRQGAAGPNPLGSEAHSKAPTAYWPAVFEAAAVNGFTGHVLGEVKSPASYNLGYQILQTPAGLSASASLFTGRQVVLQDLQTLQHAPGDTKEQRIDRVFEFLRDATQNGCMAFVQLGDERYRTQTAEQHALGIATGAKDGVAGEEPYIVTGVYINKQGEKCVLLRSPYGVVLNNDAETYQTGQNPRQWIWPSRAIRQGVLEGPVAIKKLSDIYDAGTASLDFKLEKAISGGTFYSLKRYVPEDLLA
jgi:hypothetical protein